MASITQILAMLLTAMLITGSPSQESNKRPPTNSSPPGEKLFVAHCALCHGIGGGGGRGPSLNHPNLRRAGDNRALFRIIQEGIEGTEMPSAWQLTEREIGHIVDYLRSLGRTPVIKLPGEAIKGKGVYETKGGCATCHIVSGKGGILGPDLTDVGARRSAAYLREALLDPDAAAPEGFAMVSIVKQDGRKLRGIRVNEDSFTIQLRDSNNVYHSLQKSDLTDLKKDQSSSMPSYRNVLSAAEIDDLVAYLAGLRGDK